MKFSKNNTLNNTDFPSTIVRAGKGHRCHLLSSRVPSYNWLQLEVAKMYLLSSLCLPWRMAEQILMKLTLQSLLKYVDSFQFWLKSNNHNGHCMWWPTCIISTWKWLVGNPQLSTSVMILPRPHKGHWAQATMISLVSFTMVKFWQIRQNCNAVCAISNFLNKTISSILRHHIYWCLKVSDDSAVHCVLLFCWTKLYTMS
jgi:hypothetical protein